MFFFLLWEIMCQIFWYMFIRMNNTLAGTEPTCTTQRLKVKIRVRNRVVMLKKADICTSGLMPATAQHACGQRKKKKRERIICHIKRNDAEEESHRQTFKNGRFPSRHACMRVYLIALVWEDQPCLTLNLTEITEEWWLCRPQRTRKIGLIFKWC